MDNPSQLPMRPDGREAVKVHPSEETQTTLTSPQSIALSEQSLIRRIWQIVVWHMGEYVRNDFTYSVIGALIFGAITLIDGSVTLSTVFWAVMGFLAVFVGRLTWHGIQASGEIDGAIRGRLKQLEQATEPKLTIHFNPESKPNLTPY